MQALTAIMGCVIEMLQNTYMEDIYTYMQSELRK